MGRRCVLLLTLLPALQAVLLYQVAQSACPCSEESLCQPVSSPPGRKEILGFVVSSSNWKEYNWTEITTLAMFTDFSSDLICYAHARGVRVVIFGSYPVTNLSNEDQRTAWVKSQLEKVQQLYADGINIDIEYPTQNSTNQSSLLTQLVSEVYTAFKSSNKNYQVTFDVAWSPNCIDERCYQYDQLAKWTDFLVIMAYDERSQIYGPCIASANSALPTTAHGVQQYLGLGISASNLVLGLPWYGYDYPCLSLSDDNICTIPNVPFRGVNCSDAAGKQIGYSDIRELIRSSTAIVVRNTTLESFYFDYKMNGTTHQVWYDDPESLQLKYMYAKQKELRGLAFWNVDMLDYSDSPRAKKLTAEMWAAIAVFLDDKN